ncbi:MAG: four helix bundle protein [Candidatus Daviesbacteria bacterium]|nr:MAG: four helix bundle protein [Candidatus Daviesbacteria bacterium]
MTYQTDTTNKKQGHGGYRTLHSYQTTTLIYDLTVEFVRLYINPRSRTTDQMVQAARSGRQNIAEGSQASATSKKTEIKLVGVARASLEELLIDYEDFLRQRSLPIWDKDSPEAKELRALSYRTDTTYQTYKTYLSRPEKAGNLLLTLIHQANYLLDRQLQALEKAFISEGGFTENLFKKRLKARNS